MNVESYISPLSAPSVPDGKVPDDKFVAAMATMTTLKEVVVYRYPRVFHIFNIVEYGRRYAQAFNTLEPFIYRLHTIGGIEP